MTRNELMKLTKKELVDMFCVEDVKLVTTPRDIYVATRDYVTKEQECLVVVLLDGAHQIKRVEMVSMGLLDKTIVHPREVFKLAIRENAKAIAVVHNHPSGLLEPSPNDDAVTKRLSAASKILDIKLLDHLIISKNGFYSYLEHGRM